MERVNTGTRYLDRELKGGFEKGSLVLLEYDTGSPSDAFLRKFVEAGLKNGEYCWVLTTMHSPRLIADDEKAIREKRLILIDSFTNFYGHREDKSKEKHYSGAIGCAKDVHNIMRSSVRDIPSDAGVRGVFDSITPLFIAELRRSDRGVAMEELGEFLHTQSVVAKKFGTCSVYTLHAPTFEEFPSSMGYFENIADYIISLERDEEKRASCDIIRIRKARGGFTPKSAAPFNDKEA